MEMNGGGCSDLLDDLDFRGDSSWDRVKNRQSSALLLLLFSQR
jgi:hypothetical protein